MCFHKESLINTNMYVEAFHRVLKRVYLKGKVNKCLDKLEKGKISERINQIRVRHQASLRIPLILVTEMEEYLKWEVHSADGKNIYHISQLNKLCPYSCSVICADCHICIHMYSCNCPDSLIICKHVHLLMHFISSTGNTSLVSGEVHALFCLPWAPLIHAFSAVHAVVRLVVSSSL